MRPALSIHARERRDAARSVTRRVLGTFGLDAGMAEGMLGDLAEEHAERVDRDGVLRARCWFAGEVLRSAPWLLAGALARGGRRSLVALGIAAVVAAAVGTGLVMLVRSMAGDPARLVADGDAGTGVVVNNVGPVRLAAHVFNARGHALPAGGVRYRWKGGIPMAVSATGIARCTSAGDATVRATLGRLSTDVLVRCRPVTDLAGQGPVSLILGAAAVPIAFAAFDSSGHVVSLVHGEVTVADSSIVSLLRAPDGERLMRARAPGDTRIEVAIGDRSLDVFVSAYRRASSLARMRPGDHLAVAVRLSAEETQRWILPPARELYLIRMLPDGDDREMPALAVLGANCVDSGPHAFMCAAIRGAQLVAYAPAWGDRSITRHGTVAVERREFP